MKDYWEFLHFAPNPQNNDSYARYSDEATKGRHPGSNICCIASTGLKTLSGEGLKYFAGISVAQVSAPLKTINQNL